MHAEARTFSWWGEFRLDLGEVKRWHVGPTGLWIQRREHEWRLWHQQQNDPLAADLDVASTSSEEDVPEGATPHRFTFGRGVATVSLTPALADRAVIAKPESPFFVPSGESVTLFVSTPAWIVLQFGSPPKRLMEIPAFRASDTWFGSSTLEGELAYATRTSGRLSLAELPLRPHRAVTPVRIRNRAADALFLERLKVPVTYLSLFRDLRGDGAAHLWTEAVTLVRDESGDLAGLQIGRGAPDEAGDTRASKVAGPRQQAETNLVLRAFSKLFRGD